MFHNRVYLEYLLKHRDFTNNLARQSVGQLLVLTPVYNS